MFRILVATGRSAQRRSPTPLLCIQQIHSTITTRQHNSTAAQPAEIPDRTPITSSSAVPADSPPSLLPSSRPDDAVESKIHGETRQSLSHDDGAAENIARSMASMQPTPLKPAQPNHDASEIDPAKPVKRGRGCPAEPKDPKEPPKKRCLKPKPKVEGPLKPRKKPGPKPKPKVEGPPKPKGKAGRKPKITECPPAEGNVITLFENRNRTKHATFTSRNIRADYIPYLQWARGYGQGRSIGDNRRINIVSESLCDDTLTRLKPSLEKHIGCDIIEVNPGIGIWSEKLHNILKPRTHILFEADHRLYQPILQPLLDAPGSTFKLIPKSGLVWGHMEKALSDEYLPHQEPLVRGDPRLEKPNDTLLFVANLGHYPKRSFKGFSSMANLVLYQFMSALRTHSLFQRYGQVRMLIWVDNDEKDTILPQSISLRRKAAIEAEISCEKIQVVAASTTRNTFPRDHDLELQSTRLAYEKMDKMGIRTPQGRESSCLEELISGVPSDLRKPGSVGTSVSFLEELRGLEAQYAAGKLGDWEYINPSARRSRIRAESPELSRLRKLRYLEKFQQRKFEKREGMKTELDEIFALQREVHATRQPEQRQALEEVLKHRTDAWKGSLDGLDEDSFDNTMAYLDNGRIFGRKPQSLMWDRRDYEPLKVRADEFLPMREMCLLDIQPKSLWPVFQENFPDNYDAFEYILSQLLIIPSQNIYRGLSALAPGAYHYLIAECPSLTDPTKGGSLDVELTSVRCLTDEMLKEIIEAWVRWPFKPNRFEIMGKLGSTTWDPDASATDQSDD